MKKKRRRYTPEEKVAILRRHLIDKVAVSALCEEYNIQPTVFYRWQKQFFENGAAAFQSNGKGEKQASERRIAALEEKIIHKNEVLSELMEEHVALKKKIGQI